MKKLPQYIIKDFINQNPGSAVGVVTNTQEIFHGKPRTIADYLLQLMVKNGMTGTQAHEVLARFKAEQAQPVRIPLAPDDTMKDRWDDAIEGYPIPLITFLVSGIKLAALAYIDEKIPNVWFRTLFE